MPTPTIKFLKRLWEMRELIGGKYRQLTAVILIGQDDISRRMQGKGVQEVRVRTDVEALSPISQQEAMSYLEFKLKRAGGSWMKITLPELREELSFGVASGALTPQGLNRLAGSLLEYGCQLGEKQLTLELYWSMLEYHGANNNDLQRYQEMNRRRNENNQVNQSNKSGAA